MPALAHLKRHPSAILLFVQLLGVLLYPWMDDSTLGRVTAGTLRIGDAVSSDITVTGNVTRHAGYDTLSLLTTDGSINTATGATLAAANLAVRAGTGIGTTGAVAIDAAHLLFASRSGPVQLRDASAVTLTSIDDALIPPTSSINGDVFSAAQAKEILAETGARGLMIGRGAIRNPWLFDQIRAGLRGKKIKLPTGRDVLNYIRELWDNEITPGVKESAQVQRMKKFMNYIGEGIGEKFLFEIQENEDILTTLRKAS